MSNYSNTKRIIATIWFVLVGIGGAILIVLGLHSIFGVKGLLFIGFMAMNLWSAAQLSD